MAKITIKFESTTALKDGAETITYEVDEAYAPDFVAAVAAHPVHGQKQVNVQYQELNPAWSEEQEDPNDPPKFIDMQRWETEKRTFREGLQSWSNMNVRDPILNAVNTFRIEKAKAEALAAVQVEPIAIKE